MNQNIDRAAAAEALATVQEHQERVAQAVRVPWWGYVDMVVFTAGTTASNDFVSLTGAKAIAAAVLSLFVLVLAITFLGRVNVLGWARGVQRRQQFAPPVFLMTVALAGTGAWLLSRYGTGFTNSLAKAVGMSGYPATVSGVVYGVVFTGAFALIQVLNSAYQRKVEQ